MLIFVIVMLAVVVLGLILELRRKKQVYGELWERYERAMGRGDQAEDKYSRTKEVLGLLAKEGDFSSVLERLRKKQETPMVWVICPSNGCNCGGPFIEATANHQDGEACSVCYENGTYTAPAHPIHALSSVEREAWDLLKK